jgi:hypothetical protein
MHGTEELFPASLRPCASQDHDAYLQSFWIANTLNLARMRAHVLTMQPDMHIHNQPPPLRHPHLTLCHSAAECVTQPRRILQE